MVYRNVCDCAPDHELYSARKITNSNNAGNMVEAWLALDFFAAAASTAQEGCQESKAWLEKTLRQQKWATDDDIAKTLSYLETVCLHRCLRNRCWLEPLQEMIMHTKNCLKQLPSKRLFQELRRESGLAELEEGRAHLEAIRLGWPSAPYSEPGLQRARGVGENDYWLILPIELFPEREKELLNIMHSPP